MCQIKQPFNSTPEEVFSQIKEKIDEAGGILTGDISLGSFSIPVVGSSIEGNYTISNQNLNVTITRKPFILTCNQIKKYIEKEIN